jgi:hypothetical protein
MSTSPATLTSRLQALAMRADVFLPEAIAEEDRVFLRDLVVGGGLLFVATFFAYLFTLSWAPDYPRDSTTLVVGRDFMNFWMYGQAATSAEPGRFYDPAIYNAHLGSILGRDHPGLNWSYPPSIMLLAAPFGLIGYFPALLAWSLLGIAVFIPVALRYARGAGIAGWKILIPVVISPAAGFCLISGQSSFFTAALLIGAFFCLDRRPVIAGILIGLLTLKPQLGLLFPVMLIASGRWRVFAVAAVMSLGLAAGTAAIFGPQVWADFVTKGLPVQNVVLADPHLVATPFYPTVFMNIRGLGAPYGVALAGQLVFSAFALGAVAWAFHRKRDADPHVLFVLFLTCSISFSPYLLAYDVLPATFAAVILLATGKLDPPGRRLMQLLYWLPALQLAFGLFHLPGPALIPPAVALYLVLSLSGSSLPRLALGGGWRKKTDTP